MQNDLFTVARDFAMARVEEAAERRSPGWGEEAFWFLRQFIAQREWFLSSDVIDAAREAGMTAPHDPRAWGPVFMRAARERFIQRDGSARHPHRHAAICVRWRSNVYGRAA